MRQKTAIAICIIVSLAVYGYGLVYLPMKQNYERNGCVWLECPLPASIGSARP